MPEPLPLSPDDFSPNERSSISPIMSELAPLLRDQRKIDANHLKLLSIFHYVGAGLALLGILFLLAHFAIFHAFFANPKMWANQKEGPPPAEFFAIFKWFYLVFGVWFLASGVVNVISGLWIRARKHRTFSLVVGGINCLHIPLGTVLGVFTIIVLVRDSVQELYEPDNPRQPTLGPPPH
jgi:hypothetical protein